MSFLNAGIIIIMKIMRFFIFYFRLFYHFFPLMSLFVFTQIKLNLQRQAVTRSENCSTTKDKKKTFFG